MLYYNNNLQVETVYPCDFLQFLQYLDNFNLSLLLIGSKNVTSACRKDLDMSQEILSFFFTQRFFVKVPSVGSSWLYRIVAMQLLALFMSSAANIRLFFMPMQYSHEQTWAPQLLLNSVVANCIGISGSRGIYTFHSGKFPRRLTRCFTNVTIRWNHSSLGVPPRESMS